MEIRDLEYDNSPLLTVTRGFVRTIWAVRLHVVPDTMGIVLPVIDPEDLPILMLTDFRGKPADFGHTHREATWQSGGVTMAGGQFRTVWVSPTWQSYGSLGEGRSCRIYVHPLADVDLSSWG